MKMKAIFPSWFLSFGTVFLFVLLAAACGERKTADPGNILKDTSVAKKVDILPINPFIQQELKKLYELPVAITQYKINPEQADKIDSSYSNFDTLQVFAQRFLRIKWEELADKLEVTESSFFDQTIGKITFHYEFLNNAIGVHSADVFVNQNSNGDQIHAVYFNESENVNGSIVHRKYHWQRGGSCMIIEESTGPNNQVQMQQIKFKWDDPNE
jgi:hypothetical protein